MNKKIMTAAAVTLLTAAAAFGRTYDLAEQADVDLSGVSEVVFDLRGPNCAVCVSTMNILSEISGDGSGGAMVLKLDGQVDTNRENTVPSLNVDEAGRRVTVRLYPERKTFFALSQGGSVAFTAILPDSFRGSVSVTGASDDIVVRDFELEEMDVKSSSGNLDADNIRAGIIGLDLSSGNTRADGLMASDTLTIESSSGRVDLGTLEGGNVSIKASSGEISLDSVEAGERLDIKASSGRISVGSLSAGIADLESSSGRVTIDNSNTDSISVDASSGNINIGSLESRSASFELSSGNLFIAQLKAGRTDVKSSGNTEIRDMEGALGLKGSSGRVDLGFTSIDAPIDLDISSGSIDITLPAGSAFDVDLHTSSGRVRSDFAIMGDLSSEDRGMKGSVNGGGTLLKAETSSGSIRLIAR